jgi:D-3-phosphoglycerate dehydrogenase
MEILISEAMGGESLDRLRESFAVAYEPELWRDPVGLRERLASGARALIVRNQTRVTRELLDAAKQLEVIGRAGVGLENIDLTAASERGIVVAWTPEQNANSVAELTVGLILALARHIPAADRDTRAGHWNRQRFTGIEILGKTLGVIGLGRIGAATAAKARALGMEIAAYDPLLDSDSLRALELRARILPLEELLAVSDVVTCHLPATAATVGLLDAARLSLLKPTACLINTSRGTILDEAALIDLLGRRAIAGAALDVRAEEPPTPSPLSAMENVILLPHIAAFTTEGQRRVVTAVCRDVAAVLRGEPARFFANFPLPRR